MKYIQRNVSNASALLLVFAALLLLATPALLAVRADPINPNLSWNLGLAVAGSTNTATFGVANQIPSGGSDPDCPAGAFFSGALTVTMPDGLTSTYSVSNVACGTQNLHTIYPTQFTPGTGAPRMNTSGTYTAVWAGTTTALVGGVHPAFSIQNNFGVFSTGILPGVPEFGAPAMLVAAIGLVAVALVKKANLIKV